MRRMNDTGGAGVAPPDVQSPDVQSLEHRIRALAELPIGELKQAWTEAWNAPPPKGARRRLMMLGIAWKWQAEVHGGFGKPLERRLATLEAAFRQGGAPKPGRIRSIPAAAAPARRPADPDLEGRAPRGAGHARAAITGAAATGARSRSSPARSPAAAATARPSSVCATGLRRDARRCRAPARRSAARSTPARAPRRGWSRRSTRSTRSARPAPPMSSARSTRAGPPCPTAMTMAASPAARWTALPCSGCSRTSGPAGSTRSWSTRSTG